MTGRPRLVVLLEFEADACEILLEAPTYEGAQRLRWFLQRSQAFRRLPEILERLRDDLLGADGRTA
jgi:hypothetical protein